jgi:Fe-S cluster biogenesis protein NfuA
MFIQTEQTPNPATLKFLPGRSVLGRGTADFPDASTAARSPLAARLFGIDGVAGVFLGTDFVTITKGDGADWYDLKPQVLGALLDHYTAGDEALIGESAAADGHAADGEDDAVVAQIKELLDQRVRPAVAQDGGDITFHRFEDGVVYLTMRGACSGCPSSTATLKSGIERLLTHYIPEVREVRAVR